MDKKYIVNALRPLKLKIYIHKTIKILLYALIISGFVSLVLVLVSLFAVIPFVRHKMLLVMGSGFLAALFASLFFVPSIKQVIMTADNLGLKERIITAWYLLGDNSEVAMLQRQDTKKVLESTNLASAYKIKVEKHLYIISLCVITVSLLLSFVPGRVSDETRIRESLLQQMEQYEKKIEEEIKKQKDENPGISDEQLKQLKEALEKLKEEFKKSESEEDALKALAQMENQMEKLMEQEPLKDLSVLENQLSDSALTKDMAEALKNKDKDALQDALEQLESELENEEKMKELADMLQQAAMNMGDSSMLAEALQSLASEAGSGNVSGSELTQSLKELIQQTEENAAGQQDFENALAEISETLGEARRSISAVDQRVASGNTGTGKSGGNANKSNNSQGGGQQGSGSQNKGQNGSQSGSQSGNGSGNQKGNQSGSGKSSGSGSGGSQSGIPGNGAGGGSTSNDSGYTEGDQPGRGRAPGSRKEEEYKMIYVPTRLGGEGNESTLPGQKLDSGSSTYNEAAGPVKKGEMVPYQEVLSQYREEAVQTMERQDIPAGMKELVKSYFSSLD